MDKLKNMAGNLGNVDIKDKLQGISFPASKDQVCSQLEKNGVPKQIVDKLKDVDTSQFGSADEVVSKVKSLF
ncbi:MAG TPA: DUF2795 domain-containing protein [Thermomicrobiales bacterium]|nr:DUF2795 domain-containing protein [Thermomicrobiales bacterium]